MPLSVYKARGYEVDEGFTTRNPCEWSPGLAQWTYLLVESSVSEQEIRAPKSTWSRQREQYASAKLPRWLQMRKRTRYPQPQGLQQLSWTWSQSQMKAICLQDQSKLCFNLALTCSNLSAHGGSLSRNIYNESVDANRYDAGKCVKLDLASHMGLATSQFLHTPTGFNWGHI